MTFASESFPSEDREIGAGLMANLAAPRPEHRKMCGECVFGNHLGDSDLCSCPCHEPEYQKWAESLRKRLNRAKSDKERAKLLRLLWTPEFTA